MLVLSRHRDESVIIGDDITVTIVDVRGFKVRLGISAPIEIAVHRQEVYEAIRREAIDAQLRDRGEPIPPLRKGEGDSYGPPPDQTRKERNDERQQGFAGGGQGQ